MTQNKYFFLLTFLAIASLMFSCAKEEESEPIVFPPLDKGNITANRFLLSFERQNSDSTYEFYEKDGNIITRDTIIFTKPRSGSFQFYSSSIDIMMDNDTVTDKIEALDSRYIICYTGYNDSHIRLSGRNKDTNGVDLGTTSIWASLDEPGRRNEGIIRVELKYQPARKDGSCDAGSRIIEGTLPYRLID